MRIAVINTGASTLKLALLEAAGTEVRELWRGQRSWTPQKQPAEDLRAALAELPAPPEAFGHRVVHGGAELVEPAILTPEVESALEALVPLAPLHNGPALAAIRELRRQQPRTPAVAVFDTAFHAGRPAGSLHYALPPEITERFRIRRYGFHGIAHASLVETLADTCDMPADSLDAVTLQLGAGCSACAVRGGRSVETSMGFTPLEGLVMATRSGDIDPAIVLQLSRAGFDVDRIDELLTRQSGLRGLCGSSEMREILAAEARGDERARFALELFCRRIVLTVGAYFTLLDGRGALVFGGGIGTHAAPVRERVAAGLAAWNIRLDARRNAGNGPGRVSADGSREVYVFATDEEAVIARLTAVTLGR